MATWNRRTWRRHMLAPGLAKLELGYDAYENSHVGSPIAPLWGLEKRASERPVLVPAENNYKAQAKPWGSCSVTCRNN